MTPRGLGLLGSVAVLWVVARSFAVPHLQMAAVGALVLVAVSALSVWLRPVRLAVDRGVSPTTLWFSTSAEVRLELRNTGRLPTPPASIDDRVADHLDARTGTRLAPLRPGRRATVTYTVHGRQRGRATLGPVTVRWSDPFGVASRTRTLDATSDITVYPPIWQLPPGLPLGGATTSRTGGRRHASASGDDLADVREYVRGDDLRAVHWPSTAHRGKLMVRRAESSSSPAAVLLLDRRADHHHGTGPDASLETAVAAAASASYHLATRGRSLILVDGPLERAPEAAPWDVWLERLAEIRARSFDLRGVLRRISDGVAGDGALVAIVTVPAADELGALVRAGRGFSTRAALVIDAPTHAGRAADAEAERTVEALRAAGWRAVVLRHGEQLDDRWRQLIAAPRAVSAGR